MTIKTKAANAQFVPTGDNTPDALTASLLGAPAAALPLAGTETAYVIQNGTLCVMPAGLLSIVNQGTVNVAGTTTTLTATGISSLLMNGKATGGTTTVTINGGFVGQTLRVDHKQGATAEVVLFDSSVDITSAGSFTATPTASIRDCMLFENLDGTHWALQAITTGISH